MSHKKFATLLTNCLSSFIITLIPTLYLSNSYSGWNDAKQAIIASKIGINTYRVWLPESYLDQWGYDIAFKTGAMGTYKDVGFKNLVGNLNSKLYFEIQSALMNQIGKL